MRSNTSSASANAVFILPSERLVLNSEPSKISNNFLSCSSVLSGLESFFQTALTAFFPLKASQVDLAITTTLSLVLKFTVQLTLSLFK